MGYAYSARATTNGTLEYRTNSLNGARGWDEWMSGVLDADTTRAGAG
jgi:hypothetical protein